MHHHYRHQCAPGADDLWVVTVISNPVRYRTRYEIFNTFKQSVEKAGANLFVVEVALGDRPFEMTEEGNPNHLQLRTWDEMWHKENALNQAIERLPRNWQYVAWIDCDVEFCRSDWAEEIVHQLQHYEVIQCFSHAIDLGPQGEMLCSHKGFVSQWQASNGLGAHPDRYGHWHPGYAWACRREAFDALGGLIDWAILGAADHHMAWALVGRVQENTRVHRLHPSYLNKLLVWQERADTHIRQDIGFMPGTIYHHWHGKKKDRKYADRWQILVKHRYNPDADIKRDWQGLYQFSHAGHRLRNSIRAYFRQRSEDSIDLD